MTQPDPNQNRGRDAAVAMYNATGTYGASVTRDEKVNALYTLVNEAAYELLDLGVDEDMMREWLEIAAESAVLDYESDTMGEAAS